MRRALSFLHFFILSCVLASSASAQQSSELDPANQVGLPPGGVFTGSDFDLVSMSNGNLHIQIPLVAVPGRGISASFSYIYDNQGWSFNSDPARTTAITYFPERASSMGGEVAPNSSFTWTYHQSGQQCSSGSSGTSTQLLGQNYVLREPDGTKHAFLGPIVFENSTTCNTQGPSPVRLYTGDGSGWTLLVSKNTLQATTAIRKDGFTVHLGAAQIPGGTLEDTNGNQQGLQDTLGRSLPGLSTDPQTPNGFLLQYSDSSGNTRTIKLAPTSVAVSSSFCAPSQANCHDFSATLSAIGQILLPNNTSYTFSYVPSSFEQLSSVVLPTGATISWTWQTTCSSFDPSTNTTFSFTCAGGPRVKTRTVTVGGQSFQWEYSWGALNEKTSLAVNTVTDPAGNKTVYTSTQGAVEPCQNIQYFDASGNLIKTEAITFPLEVTPSIGNTRTRVFTSTWNQSNSVSKAETDRDSISFNNGLDSVFVDTPIETREYAFGTGAPGALVRRTHFTYLHETGTSAQSYLNANVLNRPLSKTVYDGSSNQIAQTTFEYDNYTAGLTASGAVQHDPTFSTTYVTRGNLTATSRWRNSDGAFLTTRNQYDDAGNVLSTTDPLGHSTSFDYTDSWGSTTCAPSGQAKAYITKTTNALSQVTKHSYYSCTGLIGSTTDANSQVTTQTYDSLNRPLVTTFPDTGALTNSYDDSLFIVTTSRKKDSASFIYSRKHYDQLGRLSQNEFCEDGTATCAQSIKTDTTYDALGRVQTVSNPYRTTGLNAAGTTTYAYDALGRVTLVTLQDGSVAKTAYCGSSTLVTDPALKWRRSRVDGLGRLVEVDEPNSPTASVAATGCPGTGEPIWVTSYSYDALNNLTSVIQNGSRQRTFAYDSLSRLTSSINPESNTAPTTPTPTIVPTIYGYDNNGNLITKTAPAPNQQGTAAVSTTYSYDALNRLTQKLYTGGTMPTPTSHFLYDVPSQWGATITNIVGRLSEAYIDTCPDANGGKAGGNQIFSYDPMGRVILNMQSTPANCGTGAFSPSYTYDLAGNMTSYTNGRGGLTFTQSFDSAGRAIGLTQNLVDTNHPATLATIDPTEGYYPNGAIGKVTYGNGLTEATVIEPRLQPCVINVNSSSSGPAAVGGCVGVTNPPTGTVQQVGFAYGVWGSTNNGNVTTMIAAGAQSYNRTYAYDQLNRLSTMTDSAPSQQCKGLSWTYDPWGNRTAQSNAGGTCYTFSATVNPQNQLVDIMHNNYQYDAAGNMIADGSHTYTYDAENRLTQVDSGNAATYSYDAVGRRVRKTVAGAWTDFIYDLSGNVLTEFTSVCAPICVWRDYFSLNGMRIGEFFKGLTYFVHTDHLGTTRLMTGLNQAVVQNLDYLPYGEITSTDSGISTHKFTGKERDSESGLDNFGARYDSSSIGRFMSPDPLMASATVHDPQTWNRYAYALNNPLKYVDPTGMVEESAADCKKDKQCVTVKVNVIYDQQANLTDKQKETFNKQQLQGAKDEYGDAHIHLDVSYTAGGYDDKGNIQGLSKDSINVIVSDFAPGGGTAVSQVNQAGYALTQVNINTAAKGDLAHEFAHDFLGDTTGLINNIAKRDPSGIINAVSNAAFDIVNDGMREAMKNPSPYVRSSIVAPQIFNSGAKQFQQMLTQQAAIRPRQ